MDARQLALLGALGGAAALYGASRTQRGGAVVESATDSIAPALDTIAVTAKRVGDAVASAFTPRGIRNNNPGNIEWIENARARWRGMVSRDGRYGVFDRPANGIRAIGGELRASIRKGHSLAQAIEEWAPPTENDTGSYLRHVEALTGYSGAGKLTASMIPAVATAIIRHENGTVPYAPSDIAQWVNA